MSNLCVAVSHDDHWHEQVQQVAALARTPVVAVSPWCPGLIARLDEATLVLVDPAMAPAARLPRRVRSPIVAAALDADDATIWARASVLGARSVLLLPDHAERLAFRVAARARQLVGVLATSDGTTATELGVAMSRIVSRVGLTAVSLPCGNASSMREVLARYVALPRLDQVILELPGRVDDLTCDLLAVCDRVLIAAPKGGPDTPAVVRTSLSWPGCESVRVVVWHGWSRSNTTPSAGGSGALALLGIDLPA